MKKTTYHNGWSRESLMEFVSSRMNDRRLVYNTDAGYKYDLNGDAYEVYYTDFVLGAYPYTMNIKINGTLAQTTRYE